MPRPLPRIRLRLTAWVKVTDTQLTNFISSQSITQKQALQSIIVLTKQICAIALYDGQRRNALILSSPVSNQATDAVYSTPALRELDYHVKKSPSTDAVMQ
ncbi:hypothetical protein [Microcoleus sp. herbarium2]|uniref:hypothetical protein n=1 Tax=Microcoleus sp. herbarium2 TaxID=3055433 RepID=UPI002FCEA8D1